MQSDAGHSGVVRCNVACVGGVYMVWYVTLTHLMYMVWYVTLTHLMYVVWYVTLTHLIHETKHPKSIILLKQLLVEVECNVFNHQS